MPKNLNRAEQSVKSTLEDYFENIASDVSEAGGTISIIPGQSDFHLDDGQAFINFQISATNTAAIEEVLLEYDYILDRSDDPNVVDFDFNEQATSSESYEIFQTNKIFNGNTPYYGKNAEGNTLLFATAPGPDGSFNSQTGVTTTISRCCTIKGITAYSTCRSAPRTYRIRAAEEQGRPQPPFRFSLVKKQPPLS